MFDFTLMNILTLIVSNNHIYYVKYNKTEILYSLLLILMQRQQNSQPIIQ